MKNNFLLVSCILVLNLFVPISTIKAASPPDQYCVADKGYTTMIREEENHVAQSFKPKETHLSKVTMKIKGDGNGKLGIGIADGNFILAWNNEGAMAEPNGSEQTVTFTFKDLALTPDKEYKIWPRISTDNTVLFWYYKESCYDRGAAYMGNNAKTYDFDFATYGWSEEDMPPISALDLDEDTNQGTPTATVTTTSIATVTTSAEIDNISNEQTLVDQTTLTSNITKDILPPTDLIVLDTPNDNGGSLNLTWKKSKTDGVETYTIFRQTDPNGDIFKIGEVKSDKTEFVDKFAKNGETFYYFVRANKGDFQSENSNKIKGVSVANEAQVNTETKTPSILWPIIGGLLILAAVGLSVFLIIKKRTFDKNARSKNGN